MPSPQPPPQSAQLSQVGEIFGVASNAAVLEIVSSEPAQLDANAKWLATLNDLEKFESIKHDSSRLNGKIAGYESSKADTRLLIINAVRARYGLARVASETEIGAQRAGSSSQNIPLQVAW